MRINRYHEFINNCEFTNEKFDWKRIISALALVTSLNLTSCDSQKEIDSRIIPHLELLVNKQIDKLNNVYNDQGDTIVLNKTEIRGPFTPKPSTNRTFDQDWNDYYIICNISTLNDISEKNEYLLFVYSENKESKNGTIVASKSVDAKEKVNRFIDFYKENNNWPE